MDRSGRAFVEFWSELGEKGRMNPNTAGSYRSACEAVLSSLPNWSATDLGHVDIEDAVRRFRRRFDGELTEATLRTYESNFRRAVPSFLAYVNDPHSWSSPVRGRGRATSNLLADRALDESARDATRAEPLTDLPIPLAGGRTARLTLPGDLTAADAELLKTIIPVYLEQLTK